VVQFAFSLPSRCFATLFTTSQVPYRANRMVLFDSSLYHRTDNLRFKKGKYTDRRINLTFLFGTPA